MSEHSKEPWRRDDEGSVVDADGYGVIDIDGADMLEADVSQSIACVNALAGLKPEHVGELVAAAEKTCLAEWESGKRRANMKRLANALAKVRA